MPPKKATKKAASETATKVVNKRKTGGREPLKVWYMPYGNPFRVVAASAVKKLVLFLAVVCVGFYLRELVPIPEGVQDRVEQAVPPWLNSSMHMLNGLPRVKGLVFGMFSEVSQEVEQLLKFCAGNIAERWAVLNGLPGEEALQCVTWQLKRQWSFTALRANVSSTCTHHVTYH